ncbi:mCG147443 [Mus musculus]|jgi:hypothetical protein|nr:mCG147443 [Mus musculus]
MFRKLYSNYANYILISCSFQYQLETSISSYFNLRIFGDKIGSVL